MIKLSLRLAMPAFALLVALNCAAVAQDKLRIAGGLAGTWENFTPDLRGSDPMSKSSTAARRLPNREAALESLYSDISAKSMFPFWATSTDVAHDEALLDFMR